MAVNHLRFLRGLWRHIGVVNQGRQPIYLDYPVRPSPRWGWGQSPHGALHDIIAAGRDGYLEVLKALEPFSSELRRIPSAASGGREPYWANGYMSGLDAVTLYAFPILHGSRRYLEVGSGNSTRFVRRSVDDHGLDLKITSIDPSPRAEVDEICHDVVRTGLEDAPRELFDALAPGDILMLDGSHRCFQNSDVTVAFLEILPRLRPGVLVFIHDIWLPDDYPREWERRFYSEQYVLAALLMGDAGRRYEILFPAHFCETDLDLGPHMRNAWRNMAPEGPEVSSSCFWLRVRQTD